MKPSLALRRKGITPNPGDSLMIYAQQCREEATKLNRVATQYEQLAIILWADQEKCPCSHLPPDSSSEQS